jgi:hypothetical protein
VPWAVAAHLLEKGFTKAPRVDTLGYKNAALRAGAEAIRIG